jgi:outer membrane murein-binding lipoprotein Lpp
MKNLINFFKENIGPFLKKNKTVCIAVISGLFLLIVLSLYTAKVERLTRQKTELEVKYDLLAQDRDDIKARWDALKAKYDSEVKERDSIQNVLDKTKLELAELRKQHQAEIDSLLRVPDDTLYVRSAVLFPNIDNGTLAYPFSGSQVRQIYFNGISFPRLKEEYALCNKALESCTDLNDQFLVTEANLLGQLDNCAEDLKKADEQIINRNDLIKRLTRQNNRKGFFNKTLVVVATTVAGVAIYQYIK